MLLKSALKLLRPKNYFFYQAKMPIFAQRLNPILGENTWEPQDDDYDFNQEIARSSFGDMLHDTERNDKYFEAVKLAIEHMHAKGKKANVLDIGTGTGLLSMMAIRCGADSVVACEAFAPIADCAMKVTQLNGCDRIKIIQKHSTKLSVGEDGDLKEKANILVTEIFDTELIGEGALNTFTHAHKELLEDDCIVVPNAAVVYAQIVQSPYCENWSQFKDIYDEGKLLIKTPEIIKKCFGTAELHDIQLSEFLDESFTEIVPPTSIFEFDWSGKTKIRFDQQKILKLKAARDGIAQAVFMWWELKMDLNNEIILSCAPYWAHPLARDNSKITADDIPWRDHWMQAVYYLPRPLNVSENEEINFVSCHDEYSWWFDVTDPNVACMFYEKPICNCNFHLVHSRTKIGQINDPKRIKKYLAMINKYVTSDSVVLLMGDGFYVGLTAAKMGAKKVFYLNENHLATPVIESVIAANKLENVEVYKTIADMKDSEDFKKINLILGLPQFTTTIVPWDGLRFGYLVKEVQDELPQPVKVIPKSMTINAIMAEFIDLQKIREPIEEYDGLDLKPFDDLVEEASLHCDGNVEAHPLWEYPTIARSGIIELMKIDIQAIFDRPHTNVAKKEKLDSDINYNGVALWVEWDLDGTEENIISTGPLQPPVLGKMILWDMYQRQAVHFIDTREDINEMHFICNFNSKDALMHFIFHGTKDRNSLFSR